MSIKILICTVGGSPQPLITSIENHKPERIIYVASQDSRLTIKKNIESALSFIPEDTAIITMGNEQDLLQCVKDIRLGLRKCLFDWNKDINSLLIGDFTGGTKPMSAALAVALMENNVRFTYVGGNARTKEGLGIVKDGHECVLPLDNPWDVLALQELQSMSEAFASFQFDAMAHIATQLSKKACAKAPFYTALASLGQAYSHWDAFKHKSALTLLQKARREFLPYTEYVNSIKVLLEHIDANMLVLQKIAEDIESLTSKAKEFTEEIGQSYLLDLLANAQRRARLGRYDDALARLYSAIEKAAKIRLQVVYGIDTSNVDLRHIPHKLHAELEEIRNTFGKIQIPLQRAYELLLGLDDSLGQAFAKEKENISRQLQERNASLLAHGYKPIDEKHYAKLFATTMAFLGVDGQKLPTFPTFSAHDIFF